MLSMSMGGPEGDGSPQVGAQSQAVPMSVLITVLESKEVSDLKKLNIKIILINIIINNYYYWYYKYINVSLINMIMIIDIMINLLMVIIIDNNNYYFYHRAIV